LFLPRWCRPFFGALALSSAALLFPASAATQAYRFAYVANGSDDTISIFTIEKAKLESRGYVYSGPGSGPRALVVTPSQEFLYAANGHSGISGYAIDAGSGNLTQVPGSPFSAEPALALAILPSGKFAIAASGSHISSYSVDPMNGSLTLTNSVEANGAISIAVHPSGAFVYAANADSNNVSAFSLDSSTGKLTPVHGSPFRAGANPRPSKWILWADFSTSQMEVTQAFRRT
jgi:6-phosphogluconolactonase